MRKSLVEIQNVVVEQLLRNLLIMLTLFENRPPAKLFRSFNYNFPGRTGGLRGRGEHRQQQADSKVLLQIQTGSLGNPPTPSASDLTLELDRY